MSDNCKLNHRDLLQVTGVTEEGDYSYVRHRADHEAEVGVLRTPQEGKPMQKPLVMTPVNDSGLFEVEELTTGPKKTSKGPAKVSTAGYRDGWDRIFGGPKTVGQA